MSPLYCPTCSSPRDASPCFQCDGECEEFSLHAHERAVARWDKEDRAYEAYLAYQKLSPAEKAARVRASEAVLERISIIRFGVRQAS